MGPSRTRKRSVAKRPGAFHHGDLRWALLQAASRLLERDGTAGVGWRAIARLAGVSQTAPYRHFKDRESILAALAVEGMATLTERMSAAARAAASPQAALRAIAETYVGLATERPHLYRLLFSGELADKSRYPEVRDAGMCAFGVLVEVIAMGQQAGVVRAGYPTELALIHWSAVHGLATLVLDGLAAQRVEASGGAVLLAGRLSDHLWEGLGLGPAR